ncbi:MULTISPECIES: GbsR/MarR family transcriptional regulator [Amycolatopsis]|uniref:HTH marR-type domain-containing protein n=1 Tax=Amycolatopsis dongchuanensis TaxID=1070866 RepID=A0ABP8VHV5_9PSEU
MPSEDTLGEDRRLAFVEEMGLLWEAEALSPMQGRVLAYLMLSNEPYCSSAELAEALRASKGSISTATRVLADAGLIRRVPVPGQRGHFFRTEDDVWGAFLAGERLHLRRQRAYAEAVIAELGESDVRPRRRLINMRDYMRWLEEQHHRTMREWQEYKRKRDEGGEGTES